MAMAEPEDADIERCLIQTARKSGQKDEEVSLGIIRARVESKLGLSQGFLKSGEWKSKSREIIEAGFQDVESDASSAGTADEDEEEDHANTQKAPITNGVKRKKGSVEAETPTSGSIDMSGEDSSEPKQKKSKANTKIDSTKGQDTEQELTPTQNSVIVPIKDFQPPSGYIRLDPTHLSSNPELSEAKLGGKEIWHITAPSHVPISSIATISSEALQAHHVVLNHKGIDYILDSQSQSSSDSSDILLLPTKDGYERVNYRIHRILRLRQDISLPNLTAKQASQLTGSQAAADIGRAAVSKPRPQPKGLRMRYRPPGSGTAQQSHIGSDSESSDEDRQGDAVQFPKTLGAFGTEARQDGNVEMVDTGVEERQSGIDRAGRKETKKKKKKHSAKEGSGALEHDQNVKSAATDKPTNGSSDAPKSKEDKALRKEEKRVQKEEKRARKEERRKAKEF